MVSSELVCTRRECGCRQGGGGMRAGAARHAVCKNCCCITQMRQSHNCFSLVSSAPRLVSAVVHVMCVLHRRRAAACKPSEPQAL